MKDASDEHPKRRKLARCLAPIIIIAILAVQFFPADVAGAQLKLHTDQQMIEELRKASDLDIKTTKASSMQGI